MPATPSKVFALQIKSKIDSDQSIAVVARFRPPNKSELASGGETIVDFDTDDTCTINVR